MSVDETRKNRRAPAIYEFKTPGIDISTGLLRAHEEDGAAADRYAFSSWLRWIHRYYICVRKNYFPVLFTGRRHWFYHPYGFARRSTPP
jgi:hypothetical protein